MTTKQREPALLSAALRSQQLVAGACLLPGDEWALALLDANERLEQAERERDLLLIAFQAMGKYWVQEK